MAGFEILREIFQEDIRRCCTEALGAAMWAKISRRISTIIRNEEPEAVSLTYQRMAVGLTADGELARIAMVVTLNRVAEHLPGENAWYKNDKNKKSGGYQ